MRWRCLRQAQGDIRIAAAEVGEVIEGAQFQGQRRVGRHELREGRQQQALQHRVGAGQAHGAADHFTTLLHANARRLQGLLGTLGLLRQVARQAGGQITGTAFFKQGLAQRRLQPPHRTEHRGHIHPQQRRRPRQGTAAHQGQDQ